MDLKVDRVRYGHLPFLSDALFGYRFDFGEFPTAEQGLHALVEPPGGRESYLRKELPRDPWGRDYVYRPTAGGQGFSLYSAGANQIDEHGAGDDIVNGPKNIRVRSMASASFDRACGPKPGRGSELS